MSVITFTASTPLQYIYIYIYMRMSVRAKGSILFKFVSSLYNKEQSSTRDFMKAEDEPRVHTLETETILKMEASE